MQIHFLLDQHKLFLALVVRHDFVLSFLMANMSVIRELGLVVCFLSVVIFMREIIFLTSSLLITFQVLSGKGSTLKERHLLLMDENSFLLEYA